MQEEKYNAPLWIRVLYWLLFAATIVFFWLGLRSEENPVIYTFSALVCWGLAYAIGRKLKAYKK